MAISKQRKQELVEQYLEMLGRSKGLIVTEYRGLTKKQLDDLRARLREKNAGLTVTKNTLFKIALGQMGLAAPEDLLKGPVATIFVYDDLSTTVKTVLEYAKENELFIAKGGIIGSSQVSGADLGPLSELPPLEVLRAQLVGTLTMPLQSFLGLLEEPGRQFVGVIKAATEGVVNVLAAYSQKQEAA